ncbi:MAG: hypothetical protein RJQ04_00315 [Longimicrobiales bacterium]
MALTMSSILVMLIGTVFLVQSQSYSRQVQRSGAHDNARSATELVAGEIRNTMAGGIVAAFADSLTVRTPMALAAVCGTRGSNRAYVQMEGGEAGLDTDEVAGFGVLDPTTGSWSFYNVEWRRIDNGTRDAADECDALGADTVGAYDEFLRLRRLEQYHGVLPPEGSILMIFRETTFLLRQSGMESGSLALYRGAWGQSPVEYATGMDSTAAFSFRRTGTSSYAAPVTGLQLAAIDAVRFDAATRKRAQTGTLDDVRFGWSVNIPLRNVR